MLCLELVHLPFQSTVADFIVAALVVRYFPRTFAESFPPGYILSSDFSLFSIISLFSPVILFFKIFTPENSRPRSELEDNFTSSCVVGSAPESSARIALSVSLVPSVSLPVFLLLSKPSKVACRSASSFLNTSFFIMISFIAATCSALPFNFGSRYLAPIPAIQTFSPFAFFPVFIREASTSACLLPSPGAALLMAVS